MGPEEGEELEGGAGGAELTGEREITRWGERGEEREEVGCVNWGSVVILEKSEDLGCDRLGWRWGGGDAAEE